MSSIKVGPLPNGAECLTSTSIGKFNIRVIQDGPGKNDGFAVIYSYDQTRLECLEYESDEKERALADGQLIAQTVKNVCACIRNAVS